MSNGEARLADTSAAAPHEITRARSIIARIGLGAGAVSVGNLVTIFGFLVVVPIAMRTWGPVRWGEWSVLAAFTTLFGMGDLGMQNFAVNRIRVAYAVGDRKGFLRIVESALRVEIPLACALLVCVAAAIWLLPLRRMLGLHTIGSFELAAILLLLTMEPLIGVPMGVIGGVYRAAGRLPRGQMANNARQAAALILTLLLLWEGASFLALAAGKIAVVIAINLWIIADLIRLYPWLRERNGGDWREGAAMIVPGLFFLLIPLAHYLGNEFILMVIQRHLGGAGVSHYSTHRTAVNFARAISAMLTIAAWPELTAIHARGELQRLAQAHRALVKWNLWLVGATVGSLLAVAPAVYGPWTMHRLTFDAMTFAILAVRAVLWGAWSGSMTLLLSINRQRPAALAFSAGALIGGILSIFLVPGMGIAGAALALLIGDLCVPAWLIPMLACRETGETRLQFFFGAIPAPMLSLGAGVSVLLLGRAAFGSESLQSWIMFAAGATATLVLTWVQLNPIERELAEAAARKASVLTGSVLAKLFRRNTDACEFERVHVRKSR